MYLMIVYHFTNNKDMCRLSLCLFQYGSKWVLVGVSPVLLYCTISVLLCIRLLATVLIVAWICEFLAHCCVNTLELYVGHNMTCGKLYSTLQLILSGLDTVDKVHLGIFVSKVFQKWFKFCTKMRGGQSLHVHACWTMVCADSVSIIVAVLWLYICDNQLPSLHTKECQQQYMMHCMHWKEDKVGSSIYVIILDESLFYELPFHGKQWPIFLGMQVALDFILSIFKYRLIDKQARILPEAL